MKEISESVNPIVIRYNGYRQFCELLSLLSLTIGLCGFLILEGAWSWQWLFGWLFVLVFCLGAAFYFGRKAILEFIDAEFRITPQSLLTLQATRAPRDLRQCLEDLCPAKFRGEQYYFRQLSKTLTPVRCDELKNIIFKYTYAGRKKGRG